MGNHHESKFLKQLKEATNMDVELSEDSYYSGEYRMHYKRLLVNGKETRHHVDLFDLQDTNRYGRMQEQVKHLTRALMLN